jgi:hypothetical protein
MSNDKSQPSENQEILNESVLDSIHSAWSRTLATPWSFETAGHPSDDRFELVGDDGRRVAIVDDIHDATLMALASEYLPLLVAEIRKLRETINGL